MSKLISGKEALVALANGVKPSEIEGMFAAGLGDILYLSIDGKVDLCVKHLNEKLFRLKPRTITINGIEVPASAEDEDYHHQGVWILNSLEPKEYGYVVLDITDELPRYWWRTESEIKQVVSALRSVFKPQ